VSDHEQVRTTIARNNQALDDRRYDDCVATYAPDGMIAGRTGHAAIREFMGSQDLTTNPDLQRRHVNTNHVIDLDGAEADVASDLLIYDRIADGPWTLTAVGRHQDRLIRSGDGTWLFAERRLTFV
jgi:3-phenylpropionate/cinnamic acid dioxygenase small subunit